MLVALIKCITRTRFARAARVDDFNLEDLFNPERERTAVLLSAFINFIKFTDQYCDAFLKDLRERSDSLDIRRVNVTDELREVETKYDELKLVFVISYPSTRS